jgi:hypothetical protein
MAKAKLVKRKKVANLNKKFMLSAAKVIAQQIVEKKSSNNGRAPWGFASQLLKQGREIYPKLSMRTINNYILKLENEMKEKTIGRTILVDNSTNNLSSLTDPDCYGAASTTGDNSSKSNNSIQSNNDASSNSASAAQPIDDVPFDSESENEPPNLLGGRPKGSTISSSLELKKRIRDAMDHAVRELKKVQVLGKATKERLRKGALTEIIAESKRKYLLEDNITINEGSIRQRLKRSTKSGIKGTKSPMAEIEPYIVTMIIQLANMRVPITTSQGVQLCNSIIKGTKYERYVADFKKKSLRNATKELGPGYWRGFLQRNKQLIRAKRAVKFDTKRAEWCTYQNIQEMYDEVYSHLVSTGLAIKHDKPVWRNEAGEVVSCEIDAFGMKSAYELIHPEWLVFVDEVGSNTSQSKDGAIGGQTYLCTKDGRPQNRAATKDAHFTVLGFTAGNGEPIMCAIIFAAKTMREEWALGHDPFVDWIGQEDDVSNNVGEGRAMPQGPECNFRGKNVPCFCCNSENGSITGALLKEMLEALDRLNIFDRSEAGLNPFILLDGHGSRFELDFLKYVNKKETKWEVCIGLPYGTSYWQVGDSSEQNGCFKMSLTRAKQELVTRKNDAGLPFTIEKTDVVGLVREAWKTSFARVRTNVKAITSRGWGPKALNYNCLLHPEIAGTKQTLTSGLQTNVDPQELNLSVGLAATLVDRIVLYKNQEAARNGVSADEQRRKRKATAEERLKAHDKRISAGLLAAAGHFNLGSEVLNHVQQRVDAAKEKEYSAYLRKKDEYDVLEAKVKGIRELNLPYDKWNAGQLKLMVKWLKRDGDDKLPSKKQDLVNRYLATCNRPDLQPPRPPEFSREIADNGNLSGQPPELELQDSADVVLEPVSIDDYEDDEQEVAEILLASSFGQQQEVTAAIVTAV